MPDVNENKKNILILDNVRSVLNVGSLFRTADAAGIFKIYLTGVTPTPLDRFGRERKDMAKTALGAEKNIEWEYVLNGLELIKKLKSDGYFTIAIEQDERSIDYKDVKSSFPCAFVLGSETDGLPKNILNEVDEIAEIKMFGKKESLNVGVAGGIVIFRILNI